MFVSKKMNQSVLNTTSSSNFQACAPSTVLRDCLSRAAEKYSTCNNYYSLKIISGALQSTCQCMQRGRTG